MNTFMSSALNSLYSYSSTDGRASRIVMFRLLIYLSIAGVAVCRNSHESEDNWPDDEPGTDGTCNVVRKLDHTAE